MSAAERLSFADEEARTHALRAGAPRRAVRLLDAHTVNQIAAGEVVERPASVVKELVENALDAGASRIEIDLIDSGRTKIAVSDDGCGMAREDALAALQRHATSKIQKAEDLTSVGTLGFRGEALPSIASVSRLTLSTAPEPGARLVLEVEGGSAREAMPRAGPRGTEVVVEDLFYNTPARLKFLKTDTTELSLSLDHLSRYAFAYPHVAITASHKGHTILATSGSGDLLEAIAEVWGRDTARCLAEVDAVVGGLRVTGFVSPPHLTRPTRAYQYVSVNGRPVRSRTLTAALDQAYRDLTPERRYPVLCLSIEAPTELVDVNVSPTKSEVKFQREGQAFEALRFAIRSALREHGMMPSAEGLAAVDVVNEALRGVGASGGGSSGLGGGAWGVGALGAEGRAFAVHSIHAQSPLEGLGRSFGQVANLDTPPFPQDSDPSTPNAQHPTPNTRYPFESLLDGLTILGQAFDTFIVAQTRRGLAIIDQHVAHERVIYERLCGIKGATPIERQPLLAPEPLHLDRRSALVLAENLEEVRAIGFDVEPFGSGSFLLRSAPAALRGKSPVRVLGDVIDELAEESGSQRIRPIRESLWIMSSCKMAVKAGDPLSLAEMQKLIEDLAQTENPYLCPHGRPITITLPIEDLLRKFKRSGGGGL